MLGMAAIHCLPSCGLGTTPEALPPERKYKHVYLLPFGGDVLKPKASHSCRGSAYKDASEPGKASHQAWCMNLQAQPDQLMPLSRRHNTYNIPQSKVFRGSGTCWGTCSMM